MLFEGAFDLLEFEERFYGSQPVDVDILQQVPDMLKCFGVGVEDGQLHFWALPFF